MKIKYLILGIIALGSVLTSCEKAFLDQQPKDVLSEAIYYQNLSQFQSGANYLHNCVIAWGDNPFPISFDYGSDISSVQDGAGSGTNTVVASDEFWNKTYTWLRQVNVFLSKVKVYANKDEIAGPTGQAYFFRAWHHFFLLKRFGGVPIANSVTQTTSDVVWGPRASRYQVMAQIINDLDSAVLLLNKAGITKVSTANNGQVTLEAAKAFKARICLYEGTWEKYVKNTTDGDGSSTGAGTAGYSATKYTEYLTMAKSLSKEIIDGNQFSLWNGVDAVTSTAVANKAMYAHTSYFYLFNLEDATSNPNGLNKASNNEAIYRCVYDFTFRRGNINISHSQVANVSRKMMDMYLCTDGLPVQYSPLFKGYGTMTSEFDNRDYRLTALVWKPMAWYWGYGLYNTGAKYGTDITTLASASYQYIPNLTGGVGYYSRKYRTENNARSNYEESADYMQIRLAEIYLIYAEATCELGNGDISDADLDLSINKIRARAGVASLTHDLIAPYPALTLLGEIRRERALELQAEGHRISDLCRWGIAEAELKGKPTCGVYLAIDGIPTEYSTAQNPNTNNPILVDGAYGASNRTQNDIVVSTYAGIAPTKAGAIIGELAANRLFALKNYLQPIPQGQIELNPKLKQNPSW
ncbi:MAG TPA: RagB/SusD family nutrient uptake outer membrane protein [Prolixibacteraceae bacterium]|nr:RagB/SusD family nutrient uptake outer membrane protein [Prolixibacteraceae bacterium]